MSQTARLTLTISGKSFDFYALSTLPEAQVNRLPYSLKILLENVLRCKESGGARQQDIDAVLNWNPNKEPDTEITFTPARVLLQDFTGVPAVVDLAAMRDAMTTLGGKASQINPLNPVELVIDHSVMVDKFGTSKALLENNTVEFSRNYERYAFLRWGQNTFQNFRVVPPDTGIVHQVNLEYLARVIFENKEATGNPLLYPDTVVGTDSHTTMINGLGVLGWGVGGIEAEAAMLGQPVTMLLPQVVGFELIGTLKAGTTATDLVLTITEMLRKHGVVNKFVEFFGAGLSHLPLTDRATIANMAPEYGATCGIFPIDAETIKFLTLTGRTPDHIALVEAYAKAQGLFRTDNSPRPQYSSTLQLNLNDIEPCIAGPKRPQDRVPLARSKQAFQEILKTLPAAPQTKGLQHGDVVIAAITSCTNTSNPQVMLAAGLLAQKAAQLGLQSKPWVKTSLAPGSQVVTDYLNQAGLMQSLEALGFHLVGYGCTTCIGNSGPLPEEVSKAIQQDNLSVTAVLSGNRNFEGRIHPQVQFAYLASPPLVVAYALAGTMNIDFAKDPIATIKGKGVYLADLWPTEAEIAKALHSISASMYQSRYQEVFTGSSAWQAIPVKEAERFDWNANSTYIQHPPYFEGMQKTPTPRQAIRGARLLALLGDSVTTDHISPAGDIAENSPAGLYLKAHNVPREEFNSYGSRRGNHEVMMRGTFANIRLKNLLVPGTEGGITKHADSGATLPIYDCAMQYVKTGTPLLIIAGKEYGTGSSRDWAAKGTALLGVQAVLAESFERIHRSNLLGMGVLPLQFIDGTTAKDLALTGQEYFDLDLSKLTAQSTIPLTIKMGSSTKIVQVKVRIDTPKELEYFQHGGIMPYMIRQLLAQGAK